MHDLERRVIGKVMRRLIPFLILCYFVAYLDRVNVSFAKLHMNQALGFSEAAFGLGAGLFSSPISCLRCLPTFFSSELAHGFGSPAS
jgi:sugar phosphate permease